VILLFGVIFLLVFLIQRLRKGLDPLRITAILWFGDTCRGVEHHDWQGSFALQKSTHELTSSPTNLVLRQSIQTTVQKLENKPIAD